MRSETFFITHTASCESKQYHQILPIPSPVSCLIYFWPTCWWQLVSDPNTGRVTELTIWAVYKYMSRFTAVRDRCITDLLHQVEEPWCLHWVSVCCRADVDPGHDFCGMFFFFFFENLEIKNNHVPSFTLTLDRSIKCISKTNNKIAINKIKLVSCYQSRMNGKWAELLAFPLAFLCWTFHVSINKLTHTMLTSRASMKKWQSDA